MRPAFSVVFLTTLIGAGQGLFIALFAVELAASWNLAPMVGARFLAIGAGVAVALAALGLVASFFHLGHPERAWRSAARWRTSWLSREVIALPAFMATTAAYGLAHLYGVHATRALGLVALAACLALFVCTAMIYACIRFLQEWASPLTLVNFFLIGTASGCTVAAALAALFSRAHAPLFARVALAVCAAALASRAASLARNARLRPKSSLQSAIGIPSPRIAQKAQGFMGGSFNTREFFHGVARRRFAAIRWTFIAGGFLVPMALLALSLGLEAPRLLLAIPFVQYAGLLAERWFFLAQSSHPQNLYYQSMA